MNYRNSKPEKYYKYIWVRKTIWYLNTKIRILSIFLQFQSIRLYLKRQKTMLKYWWVLPSNYYDKTKCKKRVLFGTNLKDQTGYFCPTLADIITKRAIKQYYS